MSENPEIQLPEYLLVHPHLKEDPVNKQNQVGFITAAIVNTDEFYVGFDDGQVGLYSADALLAPKDSGDIYDFLHDHAVNLSAADFKDLKNIALLLDYGTDKHIYTAFNLLRKNDTIRSAATVGLDQLLGIGQNRGLKR